ncbi:MAG: preprotein translocase subunit SecE [Lachnospiraceae bacterium]|jgi:preprotein translocase SecE subunit
MEKRKISFPSWKQSFKTTGFVLLVCIIAACVIAGMDFGFSEIVNLIMAYL